MSDHPAPKPGDLALLCPTCGVRRVSTAQRYSEVRGYLTSARTGYVIEIGCAPCVRAAGRRTFFGNLLLGWWSFPWGLTTPVALIQNLVHMFARPPGYLETALRTVGVDPDVWRYDQYGMIAEERHRLRIAAAALQHFAHASGIAVSTEQVVGLLIELSDDRIPPAVARQLVGARDPGRSAVLACDPGFRNGMLWLIAELVPVDNPQDYLAAVRGTSEWLGCSEATLGEVFAALADHLSRMPAGEHELDRAFATLGVANTAGRDDVQKAYKRLLLTWHPDRAVTNDIAVDHATAKTQEIVGAYRMIVQARGWTSADG